MKDCEVLSQDEINTLLAAISSSTEDIEELKPVAKRIKIYDFKRPDVFSKENIRTILEAMRDFTLYYKSVLSATVSEEVKLHCCSVDQCTYQEYIRSLPQPEACTVLRTNLDGEKYLFSITYDPAIVLALLHKSEKTFDGLDKENIDVWKKLIIQPMQKVLKATFKNKLNSNLHNFEIDKYVNDINMMHCVSDSEMVCLVGFDVCIGDAKGMINICLPYKFAHHLCNNYNGQVDPKCGEFDVQRFEKEVSIPLKAVLGNAALTISDIKNLAEGSIIELDKFAGEPIDIEFNNKVFAKGEVVVVDEKFGIRIIQMI